MSNPPIPSAGRSGLPRLTLRHAAGSRCEMYLHGAHVTSYVAEGAETLYVSERSAFRDGTAIRGGIPVIFPQFGPGAIVRHGFARTMAWTLDDGMRDGDEPWARLSLADSAATRAIWPHAFAATLTVRLTASALRVELAVTNTGDAPFDFTGALHSYLRVGDVSRATVEGLRGARYLDQTSGAADVTETEELVRFDGEVDRVYGRVSRSLRLHDEAEGRAVRVALDGFPDAVVWNPGEDKGDALEDLDLHGWRRFVCVEAAVAASPVSVAPGETWTGAQTLSPA